jgi:hypothetical protein
MQKFIEEYLWPIIQVLAIWGILSATSSMFKAEFDNCGKTYPIDYVLYTNLFCEIKP